MDRTPVGNQLAISWQSVAVARAHTHHWSETPRTTTVGTNVGTLSPAEYQRARDTKLCSPRATGIVALQSPVSSAGAAGQPHGAQHFFSFYGRFYDITIAIFSDSVFSFPP